MNYRQPRISGNSSNFIVTDYGMKSEIFVTLRLLMI